MKSYNIVGYIVDNCAYCRDCMGSADTAVFAGDEGWEGMTCDECLHTLECAFTNTCGHYTHKAE